MESTRFEPARSRPQKRPPACCASAGILRSPARTRKAPRLSLGTAEASELLGQRSRPLAPDVRARPERSLEPLGSGDGVVQVAESTLRQAGKALEEILRSAGGAAVAACPLPGRLRLAGATLCLVGGLARSLLAG